MGQCFKKSGHKYVRGREKAVEVLKQVTNKQQEEDKKEEWLQDPSYIFFTHAVTKSYSRVSVLHLLWKRASRNWRQPWKVSDRRENKTMGGLFEAGRKSGQTGVCRENNWYPLFWIRVWWSETRARCTALWWWYRNWLQLKLQHEKLQTEKSLTLAPITIKIISQKRHVYRTYGWFYE